jgi:hypothetical protein
MKRNPGWESNLIDKHDADAEAEITRPTTKERNIFIQIYNFEEDEALIKMYTDQTGHFAQIDLITIVKLVGEHQQSYSPLPKFSSVFRSRQDLKVRFGEKQS